VVAVKVELDGLNVKPELTFSVVIVPLVALVKAKYLVALVVVSNAMVKPPPVVAQDALVPSVVRYLPELPVWVGNKLLRALELVVAPVPPFETESVPPMVIVPLDTIGPPVVVNPVVPPETFTLDTPPAALVKGKPAGPIKVIKAKVVGSYKACTGNMFVVTVLAILLLIIYPKKKGGIAPPIINFGHLQVSHTECQQYLSY